MLLYEIFEAQRELRITPTMIDNARDNKCQILLRMPPVDFLTLTTVDGPEQFLTSAKPLYMYNRWAKMGDQSDYRRFHQSRSEEPVYGSGVHPFLWVDIKSVEIGQVVAHEGRHRAAALIKQGSPMMPVAIGLRAQEDFQPPRNERNRYTSSDYLLTSQHLPRRLRGEYAPVEVSTSGWKIVDGDLLARYRR